MPTRGFAFQTKGSHLRVTWAEQSGELKQEKPGWQCSKGGCEGGHWGVDKGKYLGDAPREGLGGAGRREAGEGPPI